MNLIRKPTTGMGMVIGAGLMLPLMGVLYFAQSWLGIPFVPFNLFDWLARVLPGGLIVFTISLIKSIIAALNLEDLSTSAKIAEHILAVLTVLGIAAAIGAGLFYRWRRAATPLKTPSGQIVGAVLGAFVAIIAAGVNPSTTVSPVISVIWIVLAFSAWGLVVERVYDRLESLYAETQAPYFQMLDRRRFIIQLGGAVATITLVGAGLGALNTGGGDASDAENTGLPPWSEGNKLPNASDPVQPVPGTRPEFTSVRSHYRIDIDSLPPVLNEADWTLSVSGLVANQLVLTLDDLRTQFKPLDQFITLSCISNPLGGDLISTQRWTGIPLKQILAEAKPGARATSIKITAGDGFDESLSVEQAMNDERIMLTYAWDGLPLPTSHGFPLRVYIPDRYGMKQPKWITSIELMDNEEPGYWVRRGWDITAQVNATSVIDTVATNALIQNGDQTFVPIGGIAFAGARKISKVEVRVDDGEWSEAKLRTPLSDTTWVIWRYEWPFVVGDHLVSVRCVDGDGTPQSVINAYEFPSGASGILSSRFQV